MSDFDVKAEVAALRVQTHIIRKKRYHSSRLDKYTAELNQLKDAGSTTAELQRWLRQKKIKVAWSTVSRWMKKNHG